MSRGAASGRVDRNETASIAARVSRFLRREKPSGPTISLPKHLAQTQTPQNPKTQTAWFVAGIFVIMTIPIAVYEVAMHTEYYTRPRLQRHVVRILWMVPIYSADAWLALRFKVRVRE